MGLIDYIIVGLTDYILIGVFKVMIDFSGSPINRPMYTYGKLRLSKIIIIALTWPLGVCIEIHSEICMGRIKKLIGYSFVYLFQIIGLVLWSIVAYLLAEKITHNYFFKIPLFLVTLYLCLLFVLKMIGKRKPKTEQEKFLEMIKKHSKTPGD